MKRLFIEKTSDSPEVCFDKEKECFEIKGLLIPEDPVKFFEPVINWTKLYVENPNPRTKIILKIEYINTSSSKSLMQVLKIFEKLNLAENGVSIIWYWEDEDMYEAASDYRAVLKIPFEIIRVDQF